MLPSNPPLPRAVGLILRRPDGALLVVRRAPHLPLGGYWTPVTGRLEPGESPTEAAHRELLEETGLTAHLGRELSRGPTSDGRFELIYFEAHASTPLPPLSLQTSELSEARWIFAADLAALTPMLDTTRRILAAAL